MSKYLTEKILPNGEVLKREISVRFADTKFIVKNRAGGKVCMEPEDPQFFRELREIYPESTITIEQNIKKKYNYPAPVFLIESGSKDTPLNFVEEMKLSNEDYDYLHHILADMFPELYWQDREEFVKMSFFRYIRDQVNPSLITEKFIWELIWILTKKKDAILYPGSVNFPTCQLDAMVRKVLEDAVRDFAKRC